MHHEHALPLVQSRPFAPPTPVSARPGTQDGRAARTSKPPPLSLDEQPALERTLEHAVSTRAIGVRAPVDLPVVVHDGARPSHCRAVELSSTGMVVDRGRNLHPDELDRPLGLQLVLPEARRSITLVARTARVFGTYQALCFDHISDVDRLSLMEFLDRQSARDPVRR